LLVSGLDGKRRDVVSFRRNGHLASTCKDLDEAVPVVHDDAPSESEMAERLYAQHAESGAFTPIQLRTIKLWLVARHSLCQIAAIEKHSVNAISCRFNGTNGYGGILKKSDHLLALWKCRYELEDAGD
jgi:hypothetical protein